MKTVFEENRDEKFYRKLILLDKLCPCLSYENYLCILEQKYCWDLIAQYDNVSSLFYAYFNENKQNNLTNNEMTFIEDQILKDPITALAYVEINYKTIWKKFEDMILEKLNYNKHDSVYYFTGMSYASNFLKKRWLRLEEVFNDYLKIDEPDLICIHWINQYLNSFELKEEDLYE